MNSPLAQSLASRIRDSGPIPFFSFMEESLYHPEHGFYASGQARTGRTGDFLTPVSPGPVLGQLLARQADELHRILGRPGKLRLIEQGADTGRLVTDVLASIFRNHPGLARAVELHLVEPLPRLRQKQSQSLREIGHKINTRWHGNWETVPADGFPCFFYSCELIDSFPVRILEFRAGGWQEKLVGVTDSRFIWLSRAADQEVRHQIQRWNPPEVEGYTMELRPDARPWVQGWAEKIATGMVLTLDYGFPATELFSPSRSRGTLVAIRNHQREKDPLADPGDLDLTAHVNFTELEELGRSHGFTNYGLTNFARSLTALAAPLFKDEMKFSESWIRNFRHLTHPSFFGHSHPILVQGKSLPASFTPTIVGKL